MPRPCLASALSRRSIAARALAVAVVFLTASCAKPSDPPVPEAYQREIDAWQKKRDTSLRADSGWLTLAGLFWLKEGPNRFGSDKDNDIVLPAHSAPPKAGVFQLQGKQVSIEVEPGVPVTHDGKPVEHAALHSDAGTSTPEVLKLGDLSMLVIERGGRLAIRMRDLRSEVRARFKGLRFFPTRPAYRVTAQLVLHPSPKRIAVPNILGQVEPMVSPGTAVFTLGGRELRLDPVIEDGEKELFFIFRDQTSGQQTYGSGRFLYTDPPGPNGQIVIDFNKAFSPPCAYTRFATCPLPPPQNSLATRIEAGEMSGSHP